MFLRFILLLGIALLLFAITSHSIAHEVRPAYLKVEERVAGEFDVLWKQPIIGGKKLDLEPRFPPSCIRSAPERAISAGTISESFQIKCSLQDGIISIDKLENTLTDTFLEIQYLDGKNKSALLKPSSVALDLQGPEQNLVLSYLQIGISHIFLGWDHLLFVIGMVFLADRRQLVGVITAFTVAHSLTLALSVFNFVNVLPFVVETLIAASIVLIGVEYFKKKDGISTIGTSRPYLISFMIGLVHGCGFAGALATIGLPQGAELPALALFNIGVEIAQILVVVVVVGILYILARRLPQHRQKVENLAVYGIASVAAFWVISRIAGGMI